MTKIIFFEKTGCINNTKQKELLELAGHSVSPVEILTHKWDYDQLVEFFGKLPVPQWFNMSAPEIKKGIVDPNNLTEAEAMQLMLMKPILIRRPLMQIGQTRLVGFEVEKLSELIPMTPLTNVDRGMSLIQSDYTTCPVVESSRIKCDSTPKCN